MKQFPPNMAEDYQRYRRLMYAVLAKLALEGFPVSPADALDLIHDFFADEWANLRARFNEDRGSFSSLLYTSFSRFARARVIRDTRLQAMLVEYTQQSDTIADDEIGLEESIDAQAVKLAIAQLPVKTRHVLKVYYGATSAREAAERLRLSRHKLREAVLEGLSGIAVAMNLRSGLTDRQWQLAQMLWTEQLSLLDIQSSLKMSPGKVKRTRRKVIDAIAQTVNSDVNESPNERAKEPLPPVEGSRRRNLG